MSHQTWRPLPEKPKRELPLKGLFLVSLLQLGEVVFLPAGHIRNFEELVAVLGDCWSTILKEVGIHVDGGFITFDPLMSFEDFKVGQCPEAIAVPI